MVTGMASFWISIQRACKNLLLGSHWFSESLRYMCVSEMEPDRESECAAGKPGTDLTKVSQVSSNISICSVHNSCLTKNPKYGPYRCHSCVRDPYMSMDKTAKAGRETQAVRGCKAGAELCYQDWSELDRVRDSQCPLMVLALQGGLKISFLKTASP